MAMGIYIQFLGKASEDIPNLLGQRVTEETQNLLINNSDENHTGSHLPIEDAGEGTSGDSLWSNEETLLLISLYGDHIHDFNKAKKRRSVWTMIAERMASHGYNRPVSKIERKWHNLMMVYRKIKDNNSQKQTGKGAILYKYFEKIDEIVGNRPVNRTTETLSVGATPTPISALSVENTENYEIDCVQTSEPSESEIEQVPRKRKSLNQLNKEYIDIKRKYFTEKEDSKKKAHGITKTRRKNFIRKKKN